MMKKQIQYILLICSLLIIGVFQNLQLTIITSFILGITHYMIVKGHTTRLFIEWFISLYIVHFLIIIFTIKGYDVYELFLGPIFNALIPFLIYLMSVLATTLLYNALENKKTSQRIAYIVLSFIMYSIVLLGYNAFFSNPISTFLAKNHMQTYIDQKYPELELEIQDIYYNFKTSSFEGTALGKDNYHNLQIIYYQFDNEIFDNYSSAIENQENITTILSKEYNDLIMTNLKNYNYQYIEGTIENKKYVPYGLDTSILDTSKSYNAVEFSKEHGSIFIRIHGEATVENLILEIQSFKNQVGVPFYQISNFIIEDGNTSIAASNILYEQINQDTLPSIINENSVTYY